MAKIKYSEDANPLQNEHYGFTFQRNNYGFSMFPASKSARKRYPLQWEKMQYMSKAVRQWRIMSPETVNAWNVFAATFPQPTEQDPNKFLTGYQLFLKRHFYLFLHEGLNFDFMLSPQLAELPAPDFSIEIIENGLCVDVTEEFIRNFGLLPEVGQFIICRVIPIATDSGQFFAPFVATLEVQEVYIDGLVCSFNFPSIVENIVFSLYMSKPVYESVQYAGTKFRYMGCFKPTKFIQLTDTPETYEGQAGKIVKVKEDETGLEFDDTTGCAFCLPDPTTGAAGEIVQVNPTGDGYELAESSGGGLSCEDLLDCSIIEQILEQLTAVSVIVSEEMNTSIPPLKLGLIYNWYCFEDARGLANSGFSVIHYPTLINLLNLYEPYPWPTLGAHFKAIGLDYWLSPNTGADNSFLFNSRAGGLRTSSGFQQFNTQNHWGMLTDLASRYITFQFKYDSTAISVSSAQRFLGSYVRLWRPAPSQSNGTVGTYTGNNGRIYRTIVWEGYEFLADNLAETKWADGTEILGTSVDFTDTAWNALIESALCAYNNDWSIV